MRTARTAALTVLWSFVSLNFAQPARSEQVLEVAIAAPRSDRTNTVWNAYSGHFRSGIDMALDKYEKSLREKGVKVVVRAYELPSDPAGVLDTARFIIESKAVAAVGFPYSSDTLVAGPLFQQSKVSLVSPSGAADRIATIGPFVRAASSSTSDQSRALAKVALEQGIKKVAIVSVNDRSYSQGLRHAFSKAFSEGHGQIVADLTTLSSHRDFSEIVAALRAVDLDAIFLPNFELETAAMISAFLDAGIQPKLWLGSTSWGGASRGFQEALGGRKIKGLAIAMWSPVLTDQGSKRFSRVYSKKYTTELQDSTLMSYDAMSLTLEGILRAPVPNRANVAAAIQEIKHLPSVVGELDYSKSRIPRRPSILLTIKDSKVVNACIVETSP